MDVSTTKEQLVNAIGLAERLAGKKETLPVLSCVLLETRSNSLIFRATNLEAGIEVHIPATIKDAGVVAVPAGVVSQTIRSITGDAIHLKGSDGNLSIESRGSKNLIKAIPHEEFPSLPLSNEKQGFTMSRERFIAGMSAVIYAASPSMIRPELGSVHVSIDGGNITVVATDSFRLAEKTVKGVTKKENGEMLIPLKHAQELLFVLDRLNTEDITIVAEDAQISVSGAGVRFVSRVVDAQFPNYKEIMPKKYTTEATILKNDFLETLRKARVFSGNENQIGFHVYPKRKILSATARSSEIGEMSDVLDAAVSGEDIDINFHIGYLSDCLSSIQSDSIQLGFSGAGRPLVIRGVSDTSFLYLVMPLNR